ncbi:24260_t:CDS:2, partial [Racocetra persica]
ERIKEYTKTGKMKHPSYLLIFNMMDGTENDLIFNFTKVTNETNLRRGIKDQEELDEEKKEENGKNNNANKGGLVYDNFYEEGEDLIVT